MENNFQEQEEYNEEVSQDVANDEEDFNEDGYNEDEGVPEEGYEEVNQEGNEDVIDADDDFRVQIPVTLPDGTVRESVLDQDTLTEVVSKGYAYDELYHQASLIQQQAQQSKALVDFVAQDPILSRMTWMRANNFSPEDILNDIKTIMENMTPNQTNNDPYFDDLDESQRQMYMQMKRQQEEVAQKSQQLEQQLQSMQSQKNMEDTANHNSRVFDSALSELGLDYDTKNDIAKIQQAVVSLYPNIDPRTTKFNKQQAEAILQYAGLKRRSAKTTSKIQQVTKAKSAPRVLGGSKSSGTNKRQVPPATIGNTIEDRRKALLNLGV
jgi:Fe-S-cluster formation regulator IscX/YfhJ